MTAFYTIQNDLALLLAEIDEQGGEISEEQEARLDALQLSRDEKLANWCKYLKNCDLTEAALSELIDELQYKRTRVRAMKARSLEQLGKLLGAGVKWTNGVSSLSWRKSVRCVPLVPLEQMREVFVRVTESRAFNKEAATQYIKEHGEIPEAVMVESQNLQVK